MAEPEPTDWAYEAGFVDGEGCIAIPRGFVTARNKYVYSVVVVVVNRDRDVLDWMRDVWQGGVFAGGSPAGNARQAWTWRSPTGTNAEPFLRGLRPFLRIKAAQCDNALAMIKVIKLSRYTLGRKELPAEWLERQEQHYWLQRELNHRGNQPFEAKPMHSPRKIHRARQASSLRIRESSPSRLEAMVRETVLIGTIK